MQAYLHTLLPLIEAEIQHIWPDDKVIHARAMKRVHDYFIPSFIDIINTKFKSTSHLKLQFRGLGGSSIVIKINTKLFRIQYNNADPKLESFVRYEFETLSSHDFGILAPIDYKFISNKVWWYEIKEAYPYKGATIQQYSRLFHKVFNLHKYGLYWFDMHEGNVMTDKKGNLVIVDFDTYSVKDWVKDEIESYSRVKLSDIKPYLNRYVSNWKEMRKIRYMIYAYLKIPIDEEHYMRFCFGEFMFRMKYNIRDCYTDSLLQAQIKHKGNIGF